MKKIVCLLGVILAANYVLAFELPPQPPPDAGMEVMDIEQQRPQISITIEKIVPNDYIYGRIYGLPIEEFNQYKVVIYVKTDRWYIHPYDRGGEGYFYAKIRISPNGIDGTWQIKTIKRKFLAETVAALLVDTNLNVPNKVDDINIINYIAIYMEPGMGRL